MRDAFGTTIKVGDILVHAFNTSGTVTLNKGECVEVGRTAKRAFVRIRELPELIPEWRRDRGARVSTFTAESRLVNLSRGSE